jgi:hypothetical protein
MLLLVAAVPQAYAAEVHDWTYWHDGLHMLVVAVVASAKQLDQGPRGEAFIDRNARWSHGAENCARMPGPPERATSLVPLSRSASCVDLRMVVRIEHLSVQAAFAGICPVLCHRVSPHLCVHLRTQTIPPRSIPQPRRAIVQG